MLNIGYRPINARITVIQIFLLFYKRFYNLILIK